MFLSAYARAAFLATALLAAGCSGDPDQEPIDTQSGTLYTFTSDAAGFDTHSF